MQIDKNLIKVIAGEAAMQSVIGGGIAETNVDILTEQEGLRVEVKTSSLYGDSYDIELRNHLLHIFTYFNKEGASTMEEGLPVPVLVKTVVVPGIVDTDQIEAVFEDGILNIYLPFKDKTDLAPKRIDIKNF
ncbi:Hsp20 family protein [Chondrinema litorale]|uniref:Hsp20 family protein n=1 Tax=Chondrinema litorale TaxID=2994555 RepID=UPI002542E86B|nr:Hsp20 family protein [Chondrinema litorale]UZR94222.1 Hsp20 family protein [Chondrinema litorale]